MCFEKEAQSLGGGIGPDCLQSNDSYSLDAFGDRLTGFTLFTDSEVCTCTVHYVMYCKRERLSFVETQKRKVRSKLVCRVPCKVIVEVEIGGLWLLVVHM